MTTRTHAIRVPRAVRGLLEEIGRIAGSRGMHAYAVGGCVRDWLLGLRGTVDLDVTVEGSGTALAKAVSQEVGGAVAIHQQFGTATLLTRGVRVDFATCRRETYAKPAAYPKVFAGTLEDDLFRRDFTINAMAVRLAPASLGALLDPFGGAEDVTRRLLRILHERSFLDDPSRILRGIRFAQRFGLRWEAQTETAAVNVLAAGGLGWLNAGRLQRELERMCDEPDPSACLAELVRLLDVAARQA